MSHVATFVTTIVLWAAAASAQASPPPAASDSDRASVLAEVLRYRQGWLADTTPFDACSVRTAVGGGAQLAALLRPDLRRGLRGNAEEGACSVQQGAGRGTSGAFVVRVDSIAIEPGATAGALRTARLVSTVWRGDYRHMEVFLLRELPRGEPVRWSLVEQRLSKWGEDHRPPGRRAPPGGGSR